MDSWISWIQKVKYEELRKRLDIKENLMDVIIKRKLALFGHVCRMADERKIKTVMFGMMDGNTRRGRAAKEWLDDIKDWCGKDIHSLSLDAQDRSAWTNIINIISAGLNTPMSNKPMDDKKKKILTRCFIC
jgi:hypothetical protein